MKWISSQLEEEKEDAEEDTEEEAEEDEEEEEYDESDGNGLTAPRGNSVHKNKKLLQLLKHCAEFDDYFKTGIVMKQNKMNGMDWRCN